MKSAVSPRAGQDSLVMRGPLDLNVKSLKFSVHCAVGSIYFGAQLDKLRPFLELEFWYPIEHIICSSLLEWA